MIVHVIRIDTDQDPLVEWIGFLAIACECGEGPKMAGDPSVIGTRLVSYNVEPQSRLINQTNMYTMIIVKLCTVKKIHQTWDQINNIQIT
jgi:hypothetical protein